MHCIRMINCKLRIRPDVQVQLVTGSPDDLLVRSQHNLVTFITRQPDMLGCNITPVNPVTHGTTTKHELSHADSWCFSALRSDSANVGPADSQNRQTLCTQPAAGN